jgi:hypothetical protein
VRDRNDRHDVRADVEEDEVRKAPDDPLPPRAVSSPQPRRFGARGDGLKSLVEDGNELDAESV